MAFPALLRQPSDAILGPSGEIVSKAAVSTMGVDGWWQFRPLQEPWPRAFQEGYESSYPSNLLASSAVYACLTLIPNDVAKLPIRLVEFDRKTRIWKDAESAAFSPVLRKPNRYQTRIQFLQQWVLSKLQHGNAYVLKDRDERRVVRALYVLDATRVTPYVTEDGGVYYQVSADELSGLTEDQRYIPASEIIHDRMMTPYHALCGVGPMIAYALSANQGLRIQRNSTTHFQNQSRPGGILTAPGEISDATAQRLKQQVEAATSGVNVGRLLVAGNGLKYEPIGMTAEQSQLVEQLQWTGQDIARAFCMPLHKLGLGNPTVANAAQYNLEYYQNCIQMHLEQIELLLDEALGLGAGFGNDYGVWIDEEALLRMDTKTQAETNEIELRSGAMAPDEARAARNRGPVKGGDQPFMQQQMWQIGQLAERTPPADMPVAPKPTVPEPDDEDETDKALYLLNLKAPEELLHA